MPRFAANLTMLYGEYTFLDRFTAAKEDGFRAVEFMFPYDFEPGEIADALRANDLELVLHNLPAGDWAGGERGIAVLPGREAEFRDGVERAARTASALGCRALNCLVGVTPPDAGAAAVRDTLVANLAHAARRLGADGIRLLVEPVNARDVPGFHLDTVEAAVTVMDAVGSDNLFLQYDVYHRQRSGGELIETFRALKGRIAHVQVADNPGRHEPGTGEIAYAAVFDALDRGGYAGWVGCEYRPAGNTSAGLGWARGRL